LSELEKLDIDDIATYNDVLTTKKG